MQEKNLMTVLFEFLEMRRALQTHTVNSKLLMPIATTLWSTLSFCIVHYSLELFHLLVPELVLVFEFDDDEA